MPEKYRRVLYRARFEREGVCFLVLFGTQKKIDAMVARMESLVPAKDDFVDLYIDRGEYTNMDPGQMPTQWENILKTRPNAQNIGRS